MPNLLEQLRVMPAVVVSGARQTGKSTLVQNLVPRHGRYVSLDDFDAADAARNDPQALIGGDRPVTIDEVQREPRLLQAVKQAIDRNRRPGHFLLTGSANLLLMRQVSESLAGRAGYLTLWPMTGRERQGLGQGGIWEQMLDAGDEQWLDLVTDQPGAPQDWRAHVRRGGLPVPALQLETPGDRSIWFDGYLRTYMERDLQALSSIAELPDFRRLMRAVCGRLGQLVNQTELARDVASNQSTVRRWLNLLEVSHLLVRVPAYAVNRTKRLIKTPKLYWSDTGVALQLAQQVEPDGAYLENLVLSDLLAWRDARREPAEVLYWRTVGGHEVDFIVEAGDRLLPIEVKATERPRLRDAAHLRTFRAEYGDRSRPGLLLHAGTSIEWLAPGVLAAPWWRVL